MWYPNPRTISSMRLPVPVVEVERVHRLEGVLVEAAGPSPDRSCPCPGRTPSRRIRDRRGCSRPGTGPARCRSPTGSTSAVPDEYRKIVLACQPPSTHAPTPLFMCFLPCPDGSSYTKAADSTCGVSVERDGFVAALLVRRNHALDAAPRDRVALGVARSALHRLRERVGDERVGAAGEALFELHLQRVVVRRPMVLVQALEASSSTADTGAAPAPPTARSRCPSAAAPSPHTARQRRRGWPDPARTRRSARCPSTERLGLIALIGSMLDGSRRPALPTYATLSERLRASSRSTVTFHWCAYGPLVGVGRPIQDALAVLVVVADDRRLREGLRQALHRDRTPA